MLRLPQFSLRVFSLNLLLSLWASVVSLVSDMGSHLRERYESAGDSLYVSMVRQEYALQHGGTIFGEFYTHTSAIGRQLDSPSVLYVVLSRVAGPCGSTWSFS
jgi:hypothetical protein